MVKKLKQNVVLEQCLTRWNQGDKGGLNDLLDRCYQTHLLPRAKKRLRGDRFRNQLDPKELIHQTYPRLIRLERHFFANLGAFLVYFDEQMYLTLLDILKKDKTKSRGGPQRQQQTLSIQDCERLLQT